MGFWLPTFFFGNFSNVFKQKTLSSTGSSSETNYVTADELRSFKSVSMRSHQHAFCDNPDIFLFGMYGWSAEVVARPDGHLGIGTPDKVIRPIEELVTQIPRFDRQD
jgi:hypothetical protein